MDKARQRHKVLIVAYPAGDGKFYLEGFAGNEIDIKFVLAPDTGTSNRGETLAQEYVEAVMPECYKRLYYPGASNETGFIRSIKPSDIAGAMFDREIAAGLKDIQQNCHISNKQAVKEVAA